MNSIPKQDGDGANAAAANGSGSALEQTVLGVAPAAAAPSEQTDHHTETAGAAPSKPAAHSTTEEPPVVAIPPVIIAAPTIAVSGSAPAEPSVVAPAAVITPIAPAVAAQPDSPEEPMASMAPPPELSGATPRYGTPAPGNEGQQSTVLNSDYLRVAREVAFARPTSSPGASPEAAPAHGSAPDAAAHRSAADAAAHGSPTDAATSSFRSSWAPSTTTAGLSSSTLGGATIRGFEPVPPVRAPLAESLSSGLLAVSELGGRTLPRGPRPLPRPGGSQGGDTKARWMLVCAVAFAAVGVVSFGGRLLNRYRNTTERTQALAAGEVTSPASPAGNEARGSGAPGTGEPAGDAVRDPRAEGLGAPGAASRALLANRPASERGSLAGRTTVVSASGGLPPPGGAASAGAGASGLSIGGATANAAGSPDVASQESQLAATAARHMLAGSYSEALPVYRQLARDYPDSSSYAAMARLLEKRVGTVNDTRTIAPAAP